MRKLIAIVSGDPNSINSEIIAKAWKKNKEFKNLNIFIIGNFILLKRQFKKIGINTKMEKINKISKQNFKKKLYIYDVPLKFKKPFKVNGQDKQNYIKKSLNLAMQLITKNKISGLINCSMDKKDIALKKGVHGVTELLAYNSNVLGKEVMLIYNNSLSVSPITTHIKLRDVTRNISKQKIIKKILTIDNFFKTKLRKKPKIGVLGLNPHCESIGKYKEDDRIIRPIIKKLIKKQIKISGPYPADTFFLKRNRINFDVAVGMYHDQVLAPLKTLFEYDAINITLGLPFLRVSPDHGPNEKMLGKNLSNSLSLVKAIKFLDKN